MNSVQSFVRYQSMLQNYTLLAYAMQRSLWKEREGRRGSIARFSTALMFIRHIFLSNVALSFYKVSL
jgi:hypothetical protein